MTRGAAAILRVAILRVATLLSRVLMATQDREAQAAISKTRKRPKASSIPTGAFISSWRPAPRCLELLSAACAFSFLLSWLTSWKCATFSFLAVKDHREYFSKYVNILTRVTGKGIAFLFLGCALFSTMWDNLESSGLKFLAFVLCMIPIIVGIAALVIGFIKSQKLNKVRQVFAQEGENHMASVYDQHARTYGGPHGGLTMLEFSELTYKTIQIKWEDTDLKLIFNALVSNPAWRTNVTNFSSYGAQQVEMAKIPKEDLVAWVSGGIVWL